MTIEEGEYPFLRFLREFQKGVPQDRPPLSDRAVSREGIYDDSDEILAEELPDPEAIEDIRQALEMGLDDSVPLEEYAWCRGIDLTSGKP